MTEETPATGRRPVPASRLVRPRGFPQPFPVHADLRRPWRYHVVAGFCRAASRTTLGRQLHIEGLENVPRSGPLLICSNHLSNLDTLLVGSFTPGANSAMAKRELFDSTMLAWLLGGSNVFPVDRGAADRWALRTALGILERRGRLVLWVEGTRAASPGMRRAEPGVGFLWRRHPVPILPVAVCGTEASLVKGRFLPRRVPVTVRYGKPVELALSAAEARDNQAVADRIGELIAALLPAAYRGYYADAVSEVTH